MNWLYPVALTPPKSAKKDETDIRILAGSIQFSASGSVIELKITDGEIVETFHPKQRLEQRSGAAPASPRRVEFDWKNLCWPE